MTILTARSLRSLKTAKIAKNEFLALRAKKNLFFFVSFVIFVVQAFSFWPKANKNMQFFAFFASFAVQSFF
jgi:hypothetical protein